jgi:hypothetical protein
MFERPPTRTSPATNADTETVDAAINRVLLRERAAREVVAQCQRQAEAILAAAREQARRVERRAEAREAALHALCDRKVEQTLTALLRRTPSAAEGPSAEQQRHLERAIAALCDEMVGGGG